MATICCGQEPSKRLAIVARNTLPLKEHPSIVHLAILVAEFSAPPVPPSGFFKVLFAVLVRSRERADCNCVAVFGCPPQFVWDLSTNCRDITAEKDRSNGKPGEDLANSRHATLLIPSWHTRSRSSPYEHIFGSKRPYTHKYQGT